MMRAIDAALLALIALLSLLHLHARLAQVVPPARHVPAPRAPVRSTCPQPIARLGFDSSREWHNQTPPSSKRELYWQWRAAELLAARSAEPNEAWVLLLDGDDPDRHYMHAALAHAHAISEFDSERARVLMLNDAFAWTDSERSKLKRAFSRVIPLEDLSYDNERVDLIKHVNKLQIWRLTEYTKLVFIDLDMTLRDNADLRFLFDYPGEPPTFLSNPENPYHFNSGISIVRPDEHTWQRLQHALSNTYMGGWDYTDQALTDHALRSVFGQLPLDTCPKKRLVYTHPDLWQHASRHCIHWTGEKPWKFQKRRDLQELTPLWYAYLKKHVPGYKKPSSDFKPK